MQPLLGHQPANAGWPNLIPICCCGCNQPVPKLLFIGNPRAKIYAMSPEEEKIIAALERGEATPEQQKEAARAIRDLDRELRALLDWEQRD